MIKKKLVLVVRDNTVDDFNPELWSQAGLMQLSEMMVAARLVHRDFETTLANYGDTVNVQRPRDFTAVRKATTSDITIQNAVADNVQVKLDQHFHTSFLIKDVESTKSFKELHDVFLVPAIRSIARQVDVAVNGQAHRFRMNMGGDLATPAARLSILQTLEKLTLNNAPTEELTLLVPPAIKTTLLTLAEFVDFDKVGDTEALKKASLGVKFGVSIWGVNNAPQVGASLQIAPVTGAINNSGGYAVGSTAAMTVDGFTGDKCPVGSYLKIAGDNRPRRVIATSLTSSNTTSITLDGALKAAVADDAVITVYGSGCLVNLVAGYAAGYVETIAYDGAGTGKAPQVGQLVSFGIAVGSQEYTITQVTDAGDGTGTILLDKPLVTAIVNNDHINLGPTGAYGWMFHKNAVALVIRPLAPPRGAGATSAMAMDERLGAAIRITMSYDARKQGTIVTVDMLCGITTLDTDLGALMLTSDAVGG